MASVACPLIERVTRSPTSAARQRSWNVRRMPRGVMRLPSPIARATARKGLFRTLRVRKPPWSAGNSKSDTCWAGDGAGLDMPAQDCQQLCRRLDPFFATRLYALHDDLSLRVRTAEEQDSSIPVDVRGRTRPPQWTRGRRAFAERKPPEGHRVVPRKVVAHAAQERSELFHGERVGFLKGVDGMLTGVEWRQTLGGICQQPEAPPLPSLCEADQLVLQTPLALGSSRARN
jgi:hypothetical protein